MVAPDEVWMRIMKDQGRCNAIKEVSDAHRAEIIKCLQSYGRLADLPMELHLLILENDEEKKRLKEENKMLWEQIVFVKSLLNREHKAVAWPRVFGRYL